MVCTRRNTRRRGMRGGGYQTSQQFFDPQVLPPTAGAFAPVISSLPTATDIRPVMYSTFHSNKIGGRRKTRRATQRGGFSPSIMGGFIPNAQAAIVPAALYMVYHTFVPKGAKGKGALRSLTRKATAGLKKLTGRK